MLNKWIVWYVNFISKQLVYCIRKTKGKEKNHSWIVCTVRDVHHLVNDHLCRAMDHRLDTGMARGLASDLILHLPCSGASRWMDPILPEGQSSFPEWNLCFGPVQFTAMSSLMSLPSNTHLKKFLLEYCAQVLSVTRRSWLLDPSWERGEWIQVVVYLLPELGLNFLLYYTL